MTDRLVIAIGVAVIALAAIVIVVASVGYTSCRRDPVCRAEMDHRQAQRVAAFDAEYARRKAELETK